MKTLRKDLSLFGLTMVAVGAVIGSGIFLTPSQIATYIPDRLRNIPYSVADRHLHPRLQTDHVGMDIRRHPCTYRCADPRRAGRHVPENGRHLRLPERGLRRLRGLSVRLGLLYSDNVRYGSCPLHRICNLPRLHISINRYG